MSRPTIIPCSVKGGRRENGQLVGQRHRWPSGWGQGYCKFCGCSIEQVLDRPDRFVLDGRMAGVVPDLKPNSDIPQMGDVNPTFHTQP